MNIVVSRCSCFNKPYGYGYPHNHILGMKLENQYVRLWVQLEVTYSTRWDHWIMLDNWNVWISDTILFVYKKIAFIYSAQQNIYECHYFGCSVISKWLLTVFKSTRMKANSFYNPRKSIMISIQLCRNHSVCCGLATTLFRMDINIHNLLYGT